MKRARLRTATHEAGHAVLAVRNRIGFRYVTIRAKEDAFGHVRRFPWRSMAPDLSDHWRTKDKLKRYIMVMLAGNAAERIRFRGRKHDESRASYDFRNAVDLAMRLGGSVSSTEAYLNDLGLNAADALRTFWDDVLKVAEALLSRETLSGTDVKNLISGRDATRFAG